jgi:hypothetical protein
LLRLSRCIRSRGVIGAAYGDRIRDGAVACRTPDTAPLTSVCQRAAVQCRGRPLPLREADRREQSRVRRPGSFSVCCSSAFG